MRKSPIVGCQVQVRQVGDHLKKPIQVVQRLQNSCVWHAKHCHSRIAHQPLRHDFRMSGSYDVVTTISGHQNDVKGRTQHRIRNLLHNTMVSAEQSRTGLTELALLNGNWEYCTKPNEVRHCWCNVAVRIRSAARQHLLAIQRHISRGKTSKVATKQNSGEPCLKISQHTTSQRNQYQMLENKIPNRTRSFIQLREDLR